MTECQHCGRSVDASELPQDLVERGEVSGYACSGCLGLEPIPDDLTECDRHDCERPAPFSISTTAGDVLRCRRCLREDLNDGMWVFYDEE